LIDGPAKQPELEEFFETRQKLNASHLAAEFGFEYQLVKNQEELEKALANFYEPSLKPKILEIESSSPKNAEILKQVKDIVKSHHQLTKSPQIIPNTFPKTGFRFAGFQITESSVN